MQEGSEPANAESTLIINAAGHPLMAAPCGVHLGAAGTRYQQTVIYLQTTELTVLDECPVPHAIADVEDRLLRLHQDMHLPSLEKAEDQGMTQQSSISFSDGTA